MCFTLESKCPLKLAARDGGGFSGNKLLIVEECLLSSGESDLSAEESLVFGLEEVILAKEVARDWPTKGGRAGPELRGADVGVLALAGVIWGGVGSPCLGEKV